MTSKTPLQQSFYKSNTSLDNSFSQGNTEARAESLYSSNSGSGLSISDDGFYHTALASINKPISIEVNERLEQAHDWISANPKAREIYLRIKACPYMGFAYWVCDTCGSIASPEPHRLTCSLRYCKDPNCVQARINKNIARLEDYRIYSKKLIHFEIGFPYVKRLNKQNKWLSEAIMRKFTMLMKKLGTPINALRIFDVNEKEGHYFMHYHFAQMPVKDYMQFAKNCQIAREKLEREQGLLFAVHLEGWRPKQSLFSYFAKRMAGVYGDVEKGNRMFLADMFSLNEYAQGFFNVRSFVIIGWFPSRRLGNVLNVVLSRPLECPFCHSHKLKLVPEHSIKPPLDKLCPECGLSVSPDDYSFETGLCRWCAEKLTPEYKMSKLREKFDNFLNANSKPMLESSERAFSVFPRG